MTINFKKLILGALLIGAFFLVVKSFNTPKEPKDLNVRTSDSIEKAAEKADEENLEVRSASSDVTKSETEVKDKKSKTAEVVEYGRWSPASYRAVLGTVESEGEVKVFAEHTGTLSNVYVGIGDTVRAGQVLAEFKLQGDATQIQYLNAVNSLKATQSSGSNSIAQAQISLQSAERSLAETLKSQESQIAQAQINLESAERSLAETIKSQQSLIDQAEVSLQNARKALKENDGQQQQTYYQAFNNVGIQAKNVYTTYDNIVSFLDRMLVVTDKSEYEFVFGRDEVGNRNIVLKNNLRNQTRNLMGELKLLKLKNPGINQGQITIYTRETIAFGNKLQTILNQYYGLVDDTIFVGGVNESFISGLRTQVEGLRANIDSLVSNLKSSLEAAETTKKGSNVSLTGSENGVKSAESALLLTRSQAEAAITAAKNSIESAKAGLVLAQSQADSGTQNAKNQIETARAGLNLSRSQAASSNQNAQNQIETAAVAQSKLKVVAPIGGTVADKIAVVGLFTGSGSELFGIVNDRAEKKAVAYLTSEEWLALKNRKTVEVEINGKVVKSNKIFLSTQLDPLTQKIKGEFRLPNSTEALVGANVKVRIPLELQNQNVLPLTAVSFEPDGVEVLIINEEQKAERRLITVGEIVSDSITVLGNLNKGDRVIRYQSRVIPGEMIESIKYQEIKNNDDKSN